MLPVGGSSAARACDLVHARSSTRHEQRIAAGLAWRRQQRQLGYLHRHIRVHAPGVSRTEKPSPRASWHPWPSPFPGSKSRRMRRLWKPSVSRSIPASPVQRVMRREKPCCCLRMRANASKHHLVLEVRNGLDIMARKPDRNRANTTGSNNRVCAWRRPDGVRHANHIGFRLIIWPSQVDLIAAERIIRPDFDEQIDLEAVAGASHG